LGLCVSIVGWVGLGWVKKNGPTSISVLDSLGSKRLDQLRHAILFASLYLSTISKYKCLLLTWLCLKTHFNINHYSPTSDNVRKKAKHTTESVVLTLCAIGLIIIGHFALSYCVVMHFVLFGAVGIVLFSVVHYVYNVCELCVCQSFFQ